MSCGRISRAAELIARIRRGRAPSPFDMTTRKSLRDLVQASGMVDVTIGKNARHGLHLVAIGQVELRRGRLQHIIVEKHPDVLAGGPTRRGHFGRSLHGGPGEQSGNKHDKSIHCAPEKE